jgi:hypothetical protein
MAIVFPPLKHLFIRPTKAREQTVPWASWRMAVRGMQFWQARYEAATDSKHAEYELRYMGKDETNGDDIYALRRKEMKDARSD